ncbi:MAG: glycosyltransferase family 2 protein, partial [Candidatus Bathycorpusculaceae bacterium]
MSSPSANPLKRENSNPVKEVDLVIWTKNSSATLAMVLKRLEMVVPQKFVGNKIIVDDHSTDNTVEVGKSLGWEVYVNEGKGIPDAANTALKHVTSQFFISIEHDLLLTEEWWRKISCYMADEKVAVAQGIRFSTHPTLAALDEYFQIDCKRPYVTIDNNLYRTKIIQEVGGFPNSCPVCVDLNLRDMVQKAGFKWIVDPTVISQH